MADETTNTIPTTETAHSVAENNGGGPEKAVSSEKGENAVSTSETAQTEKTFTQAELDKVVSERLAREKAKLPTKEELKAFKDWRDSQKTAEQKQADEIAAANEAKTAAEQRAADYEAKYTAMSKGVSADAVEDVIALARVKVSDTVTLEQAIDAVIVKYPQFGGTKSDKPTITTGAPSGGGDVKPTGVEAAFLAKNPGLKI